MFLISLFQGGVKAVIWTDTVQGSILIIGVIVVVVGVRIELLLHLWTHHITAIAVTTTTPPPLKVQFFPAKYQWDLYEVYVLKRIPSVMYVCIITLWYMRV